MKLPYADFHFTVEKDDSLYSYGGEYWINDDHHQNYGLSIGDASFDEMSPEQFKHLALTMMNHLITNGHDFEFYEDFGQYLRAKKK